MSFGCALPSQVAACDGKASGMPCDDVGGQCFEGVCIQAGCGNSIVEPSEVCDDGNTLGDDGCSARCDSDERCGNAFLDTAKSEGCDCGDASYTGTRPPGCNGKANSDDPDTVCTSNCQIRGCGDGAIGGLEDCDGTALALTSCTDVGFYQGTLACLPTCRYDTSGCSGKCNDDILNGNELCDGDQLNGKTCQDYGYYNAAGLACNDLCTFDTTNCTGFCGDGTFQPGNEICDAGQTGGLDCTDFGYYAPSGLGCSNACQIDTSGCESNGGGKCGDSMLQAGDEECDGVQLGGMTCSNFGFYQAAGLACRSNCTFDTSNCQQKCGDSIINGVEQCDGSVPAGMDCTDFGYYVPGNLQCTPNACVWDFAGCTQKCGDGMLQTSNEDCDGSLLNGATCQTFGFYDVAGLTCSGACTFDISACTGFCGDDAIQSSEGEQCDNATLPAGASCMDFGFYAGSLGCNGACGFSTAMCVGRCGDDLVNGPETCDGAPPASSSCIFAGYDAGQLGCDGDCDDTEDLCRSFDFRFAFPGITSGTLYDVWGEGNTFYAVSSGAIVRTTGDVFTEMPGVPSELFLGIWGSSTTNVFAVGTEANSMYGIFRYDGVAWSQMTTPAAPANFVLRDVWGTAPTNIYAVGDASTILRYTGSWAVQTLPGGFPSSTLQGVWAGGSTVVAVGTNGAIARWNGSAWLNESVASTEHFTGVWGVSATEIYAIAGVAPNSHVWRFNGSSWTQTPQTFTSWLVGIGGTPDGRVFIVGENAGASSVFQLAGGEFERVLGIPSGSGRLQGVSGSMKKVFAVGNLTAMWGHGASRLTSAALPSPGIGTATMFSAWGPSADAVYAGGSYSGSSVVYRWNGSFWSGGATFGAGRINDISGRASWAVAVGNAGVVAFENPNETNNSWQSETSGSGTTNDLYAVWGDETGTDIFAVGAAGTIRRRNPGIAPSTWSDASPGGLPTLRGVWGTGSGSALTVYAVGDSGTIVRRQGTGAFAAMASPTSQTLRDVWGRSATDVYVVGDAGAFHYDGTKWTTVPGSVPGLLGIAGTAGEILTYTNSDEYQIVGGRLVPVRLRVNSFSVDDLETVAGLTFVLESRGGNNGDLHMLAGHLFATEPEICDDFWDNDADGFTDCADASCSTDLACTVLGGACQPVVDLACGASTSGATTVAGTTRFSHYGSGCTTGRDMSGPERFYRVRRATAGQIQLSLTGFTGDLDLIVSSMAGAACTPDETCLASSQTAGTSESTAFSAAANTDYIVVVDGAAGASSVFTLSATCP